MLEVIHNNNNNYSNSSNSSNHGDNMIIYSLPETLLNKPQPPTPAASASSSSLLLNQKEDIHTMATSDDLFYRLQKENALLPPQVNIYIQSVLNFDLSSPFFYINIPLYVRIIGFHCIYFSPNRTTKRSTRKRPQINIHSIQ